MRVAARSFGVRYAGLPYVLPAVLFTGLFILYPLVRLAYISLTSKSLLGGEKFVGFKNYLQAFNDPVFWKAVFFTLQYTVYITPILMILGFVLALLTVANTPLSRAVRAIIFLPVVIGLASSSLLWFWLLDEQVGMTNRILVDLGIISQPIVWFVDANLGLWAVIISITWKVIGFGMIIFVAAIQSIGTDVVESAMIDGASYWQRVWRIVVPLSVRSILLTTLISVVGSLLAFDQFYIMTSGGPKGQTVTQVYWMYQNSFIYFKLGYGAALSMLLVVFIFILVAIQLFIARRSTPT